MKTKHFQTGNKEISFSRNFYIIQGNNGNHTGYNREWKINSEGYDSKREANRVAKEMTDENGDIKYGLTPLKIVTPDEVMEIYEGKERLSLYNCLDIDIKEI